MCTPCPPIGLLAQFRYFKEGSIRSDLVHHLIDIYDLLLELCAILGRKQLQHLDLSADASELCRDGSVLLCAFGKAVERLDTRKDPRDKADATDRDLDAQIHFLIEIGEHRGACGRG